MPGHGRLLVCYRLLRLPTKPRDLFLQLPAMWLQRCHRLTNNANNEPREEEEKEGALMDRGRIDEVRESERVCVWVFLSINGNILRVQSLCFWLILRNNTITLHPLEKYTIRNTLEKQIFQGWKHYLVFIKVIILSFSCFKKKSKFNTYFPWNFYCTSHLTEFLFLYCGRSDIPWKMTQAVHMTSHDFSVIDFSVINFCDVWGSVVKAAPAH